MARFHLPLIGAAVLLLAACGPNEGDRALSGGAIGMGTGALVGGPIGAVIGGAVGATTGAVTETDDINLGKPVWR